MKHLSDAANSLLRRLYDSRGVASRLFGINQGRDVELINQLCEMGELAAVIPLSDYLFDGSKSIEAAASEAIHRLLSAASTQQLLELDEGVRSWAGYDCKWTTLKPAAVASLPKTTASKCSIFGLASFHPNGYVREKAIQHLSTIHDGSEVPFLLIRLNDWVANVRQAAWIAVDERFLHGSLAPFLDSINLVIRLATCERDDHSKIVERFIRRVADAENANVLHNIVLESPRQIGRTCFRLAVKLAGPHVSGLVLSALKSNDAVLRLLAAREYLALVPDRDLEEALARVQLDRSMPVRRAALEARLARSPHTAQQVLRLFLLDGNPSIREYCRFHLRKLNFSGFAEVYRKALSNPLHRLAAIAGLGEIGSKDDANLVMSHLHSSNRKERAAALSALSKLAGSDYFQQFFKALTDESPKVVREAQKALQSQRQLLVPEQLWQVWAADQRDYVRRAVLDLVALSGAWPSLPYLIRASASAEPSLARIAMAYVARRYNRVFTKPSVEEKRLIDKALEDCADQLDSVFRKSIYYHIGT